MHNTIQSCGDYVGNYPMRFSREADGMQRRRQELLIVVNWTIKLVLYTTFRHMVFSPFMTSTGERDKIKTCMRFRVFAGVKLHSWNFEL
jgi:hypothetical protein